MYKNRQALDYLNDILESIEDTREFTSGMSYDGFIKDKKTAKAVVRSLEIIGEAANNVPEPLRRYPCGTLRTCGPEIDKVRHQKSEVPLIFLLFLTKFIMCI